VAKVRDYYLWDEDDYDPFAPEGPTTVVRKKKDDFKKVYEKYQEEDSY
jgi:hypothetical protein